MTKINLHTTMIEEASQNLIKACENEEKYISNKVLNTSIDRENGDDFIDVILAYRQTNCAEKEYESAVSNYLKSTQD